MTAKAPWSVRSGRVTCLEGELRRERQERAARGKGETGRELTDIDEEACEKQELCNRTGAMRKTGAYGTRPHMRSHFMFTTLLHFSYRIANPKQRAQIAIAPRGSGVPGMSAPGAGGEPLLFRCERAKGAQRGVQFGDAIQLIFQLQAVASLALMPRS